MRITYCWNSLLRSFYLPFVPDIYPYAYPYLHDERLTHMPLAPPSYIPNN